MDKKDPLVEASLDELIYECIDREPITRDSKGRFVDPSLYTTMGPKSPASPTLGTTWFDTTDKTLYVFHEKKGGAHVWVPMGAAVSGP